MKKNYTHIGFIMDRSGSMGHMAVEASNSFNSFIEEQKKVEGEATLTFVQFDNVYDTVHDFTPLNDVGKYQLQPRNATALVDAIGYTINAIGSRLGEMNESERPEKVIIAILTDGYENCSREFTTSQVKDLIKEHEDKYDWTFMYLGANQDSFAVAQTYGISGHNAVTFAATGVGACSGTSTVNKAMTAYRSADFDMTTKDILLSSNQANENEML